MLKLSWQRWKLISPAKFFGNALCGYNLLSSDFWFCILWLHFFVFRFHNVGYFITQNIYKQKEYYHPRVADDDKKASNFNFCWFYYYFRLKILQLLYSFILIFIIFRQRGRMNSFEEMLSFSENKSAEKSALMMIRKTKLVNSGRR